MQHVIHDKPTIQLLSETRQTVNIRFSEFNEYHIDIELSKDATIRDLIEAYQAHTTDWEITNLDEFN